MSEAVKILIMPQTRSIHVRLHVSILYLSKVIMHLIDREQPRSQHLLAFFPTVIVPKKNLRRSTVGKSQEALGLSVEIKLNDTEIEVGRMF